MIENLLPWTELRRTVQITLLRINLSALQTYTLLTLYLSLGQFLDIHYEVVVPLIIENGDNYGCCVKMVLCSGLFSTSSIT